MEGFWEGLGEGGWRFGGEDGLERATEGGGSGGGSGGAAAAPESDRAGKGGAGTRASAAGVTSLSRPKPALMKALAKVAARFCSAESTVAALGWRPSIRCDLYTSSGCTDRTAIVYGSRCVWYVGVWAGRAGREG